MSDFMDFLSGLSGVGAGLAKGATAGMEPFAAWEKVRSADLANDRSDVQLRDLYGTQDAREALPGYYDNQVGAVDSGYRKTSAGNERDIFGMEQQLAMQRYLSDPNDAFQQGLQETGWTPGTAEYRAWLAEAMGQFDPSAAVGAYDKMGIPGIQQRNVNEQAVMAALQQLIAREEPGVTVARGPDGNVYAISADGTPRLVSGDALTKVAAMLAAKTPYDAQQQGLNDMLRIQTGNAQNQKTLAGVESNSPSAQTLKLVTSQVNQLREDRKAAVSVLNNLNTAAARAADPESFAPQIAEAQQRVETINKQGQELWNMQQFLMKQAMSNGGGGGGRMGPPRAAMNKQGESSVTTRPTPSAMAGQAAGSAAAGAPRRSGAPRPPWDTGIRPIGSGQPAMGDPYGGL